MIEDVNEDEIDGDMVTPKVKKIPKVKKEKEEIVEEIFPRKVLNEKQIARVEQKKQELLEGTNPNFINSILYFILFLNIEMKRSYEQQDNQAKADDEECEAEYQKELDEYNRKNQEFSGEREYQVITKAANYVLQPGQSYEGVWHVEGKSLTLDTLTRDM